MQLKDFAKKKVLVMGLGLHGGGVGAAKFFARQGARVLVTDLKTKAELKESLRKLKGLPITYWLGGHRENDFCSADLVIQNPAVRDDSPYLAAARKAGVAIDTDVGVFFELCPTKEIIGVTGTKGKSTTATLIARMLKEGITAGLPRPPKLRRSKGGLAMTGKRDVILAGNIRTSVLEVLPRIRSNDVVVLELSSWQLEGLARHKKSPLIAVITSIFPDHLNRYRSMTEYAEAKKLIFRFQRKTDHLFIPTNDPLLRNVAAEAPSQVHPIASGAKTRVLSFPLSAPHYRPSVALAEAVAKFYGVGERSRQKTLAGFKGLEGRLEIITKREGVTFVNDTTATTPGAAIAALKSFPKKKIILIAGGEDKDLEFREFAHAINRYAKTAVFLPGTATGKILKNRLSVPTFMASAMSRAVTLARAAARRGDTILLSPGAASFNLFKHEFDRGRAFKQTILSSHE